MSIVSDNDFGRELVKVLGLEGENVIDIFISCKLESAVMVTIKKYLRVDQADKLLAVMKKYRLERKPDGEDEKYTKPETGFHIV